MSSVSNKDIALSIIHFLKSSVAQKEIAEDYAESMDVAIDCIADAYEVDKDDDSKIVDSKFDGKSLAELIKLSLSGKGVASAGSSGAVGSSSTSAPAEVSADIKAQADQLKVEGNRAMASRDFAEAIAKYTAAIDLDASSVVYLSNRAAAYSSSSQHAKAVEDAQKAIELNPEFSKAYSRLGLAKYALGEAKEAMDAYKKGLDAEGEKKSDAMAKGYETAKRRVEEDLERSISKPEEEATETSRSTGAGAGAAAGGMPDFSSMFGGAGGMPDLSQMMNNPQIMQAAQEMMSNPGALQGLMSNPAVRQMAQSMGLGGGEGGAPDLSNLMNNPMLNQFMGRGNNESQE